MFDILTIYLLTIILLLFFYFIGFLFVKNSNKYFENIVVGMSVTICIISALYRSIDYELFYISFIGIILLIYNVYIFLNLYNNYGKNGLDHDKWHR